jgi:hypothetical protein
MGDRAGFMISMKFEVDLSIMVKEIKGKGN